MSPLKISELSAATDVPVATLKYYLREGLLPAGQALTRTSAFYGDEHVERVRLIRALTSVGGLTLATTQAVIAAMDVKDVSRRDLMGAAQRALLGADFVSDPPPGADMVGRSRARVWLDRMGWQVHPDDPVIDELDRAWVACDDAGLGLDEERMSAYAEAVLGVAGIDVGSVPEDPGAAVRQVVLGTILLDPVLSSLRRLAQQHVAVVEGD